MKRVAVFVYLMALVFDSPLSTLAQQVRSGGEPAAAVRGLGDSVEPRAGGGPGGDRGVTVAPVRLIRFSGSLVGISGPTPVGVVGMTFALYADQEGGAPLWMETQNVGIDEHGRFTVLLGATRNEGLPLEVFASEEARWLGFQVQGQPEQPRIVLVSVPYALRAADADRLGGHPASSFVRTGQLGPFDEPQTPDPSKSFIASAKPGDPGGTANVKGSGTAGFIPKWKSTDELENSILFESTGKIGIGTITPTAKLDVAGSGNFVADLTALNFFAGNNVTAGGVVSGTSVVAGSGTFSGPILVGFLGGGTSTIQGDLQVIGTGNLSAAFVDIGSGNFGSSVFNSTQILSVTQSGSGSAINAWAVDAPALSGASSNGTGVFGTTQSPNFEIAGVAGLSSAESGTGVFGKATAATGIGIGVQGVSLADSGVGVRAEANHANATAGVFQNSGGGKFLSGRNAGGEVFNVENDGTVNAFRFVGDGSGLFNLNAATAGNADTLDGLDSTQFARVDASNIFAADQTIPNLFVGNVTSTGIVSADSVAAGTATFTAPFSAAFHGNVQILNQPSGFRQLQFQGQNPSKTFSLFFDEDNGVVQTDPGSQAPLIFRTDGIDRVYITPQGDVGVGTVNPGSKLEVAGEIRAQEKIQLFSDTGFRIENTPGSGQVLLAVFPHGKALAFSASPQNDIQITASGNVGVGTISPTERLDVAGNVKAAGFIGDGSGLFNLNAATAGNANTLDGFDSSQFAAAIHGHDVSQIAGAATLGSNTFTGPQHMEASTASVGDPPILAVRQNGEGHAISGETFSSASSATAVLGQASSPTGFTRGVAGSSISPDGIAVFGNNTAGSGLALGVEGATNSPDGTGVFGIATDASGSPIGVKGSATSSDGGIGVIGEGGFRGVVGRATTTDTTNIGVLGITESSGGAGVQGEANTLGSTPGVFINFAGGKILSGVNSSGEVFRVDGSGNVFASGNVNATAFVGDGSGLFNVSADTAGNANLLDGFDSTQFARADVGNTLNGDQAINGSINASSFSGDGGGLTNVNADFLGGVAAANFARRDASNEFLGNQSIQGGLFLFNGGLRFQGQNPSKTFSLFFDGDNGVVQTDPGSAAPLILRTDGVDRLYITPGGRVGIGTVTPGTTLEVVGDTSAVAVDGPAVTGRSSNGTGVFGTTQSPNFEIAGVAGLSSAESGTGVFGKATAATGIGIGVQGVSLADSGVGVRAEANHANATAGVFQNSGGGKFLSGRNAGGEVFNVENDGTVNAVRFVGDGSMLTNLPSGGTPTDLNCAGCVSESELDFAPATQAELDAHKSSGDHDAHNDTRYAQVGATNTFTQNNRFEASSGSAVIIAIHNAGSGGVTGAHGLTSSGDGSAAGIKGTALLSTGFAKGVVGQANGDNAVGVFGQAGHSTGTTAGVQGRVISPNGVAGLFENLGNGKILSGRVSGFVEKFSVGGDGSVTSSGLLNVNGTGSSVFADDVTINGDLVVNGTVSNPSSRRWKTNIQTLEGALAKVERLRGVSYEETASGVHRIGVVAEEVGVVVPEVVVYEENGVDARGVDYARLVAVLIEAIKEQQTELRAQQERLESQSKELAGLKEKLAGAERFGAELKEQ